MPNNKYAIRGFISVGLVLIVLFSGIKALRSQEMWGVTLGNYAGSNGLILNPTSILNSKLYMDVNILTADFFFENNYAYIHAEDFKLTNFFKSDPVLPKYGPDDMAFDYYRDNKLNDAYINIYMRGPGFFQYRGKHAYALTTGVRILSSVKDVPQDIANFGYNGLNFEEQHNINYNDHDIYGNAIAFAEIGVSYAYNFFRRGFDDWSAGITLKGLFAYSGGYMRAKNMDYIVVNDTTINVLNLNGEVGYSTPIDSYTNEFPDGNGLVRGSGFGVDIGVTYQKKTRSTLRRHYQKLCEYPYIDYKYRIGISLIDFGFVRFTKNTQVRSYEDVDAYWVNVDTITYSNMNQLFDSFDEVFYGTPGASYVGDKMTMWLPSAISLQADYHFIRKWYVNASIVQSLAVSKSSVFRPSQIVVAPRYETRNLEFSLPLSLYEYKYPRMGLSARFYFLTIGTDKLLTYFGLTDFTGMDLYFSIKINFSKGKCGLIKRYKPCMNNEFGIDRPKKRRN